MPFLHHSVSGHGEPLVVLHGLFGSGKNWQSLARQFSQHYHTHVVDLRNHGQSFHADEMNYQLMAEDVAELLQELGQTRCRVLGHSMGGKVAMMLAAKYPDLVSHLVVADIAPIRYEHHYDDLINPILNLPLDTLESRADADSLLQSKIEDPGLRSFLLQNLVRQDNQWKWRVNWSVIQQQMEAIIGFELIGKDWMIEIPTLFLRGGLSDYVDSAAEIEIGRHFTHASIQTISAAGHWLHAEQPRDFSDAVIAFLHRA